MLNFANENMTLGRIDDGNIFCMCDKELCGFGMNCLPWDKTFPFELKF